jgi:hypothetical protein
MTAVTYTTLESSAYSTIFAILDNRSNISDPRNPSTTNKREYIYDSDPFEKGLDFSGMPYIIFSLPVLEYEGQSIDGRHRTVMWSHKIIVRTVKNASSGSRIDIGRTDMFTICDALNKTFNSATVRDSLYSQGIKEVKLIKTSYDTTVIHQQTVYESEYELRYEKRMAIST